MKNEKALYLRRNQVGLTLIETMAAIIIGLVVIGGAVAMFGGGMSGAKTTDVSQNVAAIAGNVAKVYQGSTNYAGLTNTVAIKANLVPVGWVSGTTITDPWGGAVTIAGAAGSWSLTLAGVPTDACVSLARNEDGAATVTANGTTTAGSAATPVPSPTAAATSCTNGGSGAAAGNTIIWTFI